MISRRVCLRGLRHISAKYMSTSTHIIKMWRHNNPFGLDSVGIEKDAYMEEIEV